MPAAVPRRFTGTEVIRSRVLGELNRPGAGAHQGHQHRELPVGRGVGDGAEAQQRHGADQQAPSGEVAGAEAVGEQARDRAHQHEAAAEGRHHQARGQRVLAVGALQEEDQDEEHGAAGQAVEGVGGAGEGEPADAEEAQVEHRVGHTGLHHDECGQADQRQRDQEAGVLNRDQGERDQREPEQQRAEPDREQRAAEEIEALARGRQGGLTQPPDTPCRAGDAQGDVDQEDQPPRERGQQAADHGADQEPGGGGDIVDPEAEPNPPMAERVGHQRGADREQQRPADALYRPRRDQVPAVEQRLRQARQQRAEAEEDEAGEVELLTPHHVGEAARHRDQRGRDQQVPQQHPHDGDELGVEACEDAGQGDDQGRPLDRRQQCPDRGHRQHRPWAARGARAWHRGDFGQGLFSGGGATQEFGLISVSSMPAWNYLAALSISIVK